MAHGPPPLRSGLQHYDEVSNPRPLCGSMETLTLTCQRLWSMSYEPGPSPSSAASPPITLFHCCCSNSQTAREKRPAATRYNKQAEATRKLWSLAPEPPLVSCVSQSEHNESFLRPLTCKEHSQRVSQTRGRISQEVAQPLPVQRRIHQPQRRCLRCPL